MSLPGTKPEDLESCPNCGRKNRLVVAAYGENVKGLPMAEAEEVSLECEGCCSVVINDLGKDDIARMRFTEAGRRILARKHTV